MTLLHILIFSILSVGISTIRSGKLRTTLLFILSIFALYSLQPALALRSFDFWLPTLAIAIAVWAWLTTRDPGLPFSKADSISLVVLLASISGVVLSSYFPQEYRFFAAVPVAIPDLLIGVGSMVLAGSILWRVRRGLRGLDILLVTIIVLVFVALKTPFLSLEVARTARQISGQSPDLASILDLNWLGFSYIAFRLLHVLRDHRSARLPEMDFQGFMLYVLFFPALSAGPIDRVERFLRDLTADRTSSLESQWQQGGSRIARGLFYKFILADSLSLIALNTMNSEQVKSTFWLWILLYLYSFRIYFDFSGYTDIAIGIGMLSGIQLPENFNHPYRQTDLGAFWNRWHITLAQWFRAYVFNPLTRALRRSSIANSPWLIILVGQLATMILIGLWHGVTWTFFIWGLWHALGLYLQNRWVEFQRQRRMSMLEGVWVQRFRSVLGWGLTFQYVTLGWVWFSSPDIQTAWLTMTRLIGG